MPLKKIKALKQRNEIEAKIENPVVRIQGLKTN
jgi:hypothetical protein